jgi:hypothetical protein
MIHHTDALNGKSITPYALDVLNAALAGVIDKTQAA